MVDVVLLTKNSLSSVGERILKLCLRSLYLNVPVHRLIVVDGGSTDGTVEFVSRYPRVEVVYDYGTRATARCLGLRLCDCEYVLFLDCDVVLCRDWFRRAFRYFSNSRVGAVEGYPLHIVSSGEYRFAVARSRFRGIFRSELVEGKRAFTGDTLIRKVAVEGISIPSYLHVYEDEYIRCWVESRGFLWLKVRDPYCYHFTQYYRPIDGYYSGYVLAKRRGVSAISLLRSTVLDILLSPAALSLRDMSRILRYDIEKLRGVLYAKLKERSS